MELTIRQVQQDLDNLGKYKTADVDRLIRGYVRQRADASALREHILSQQQFHRIYFYVSLKQIKSVEARMEFIHENLLFDDWWHTDQLISYVADLEIDHALSYSPHKLHTFLSQFFERNRATIMLENNFLTRKCVRNISNTSIIPESQFAECFTLELVNRNEVLPVTVAATHLRGIMRVRTSTNHEVPDYFTEEKEAGFSAPTGVFDLHGTYYSLDSRASQELETMQFEESVTKNDLFLTHRRLVELYPLFVNRSEILSCLEDVHSLRQATIQFNMLRTQLPMPLNMVDRDMLMEYCVQPR